MTERNHKSSSSPNESAQNSAAKFAATKIHRLRAIFIAVVVIGLAGFGVWSLVNYAGIQVSLLWTAIIGAVAWVIRSNIEQRREHQKLLADRKKEHYLKFLEFLSQFLGKPDTAKATNSDSSEPLAVSPVSLEELRMWSLRLTLIGSDEVVKAWNKARLNNIIDQGEESNVHRLRNWGRLWLAMRKDCGHLDTKLKVSEILSAFVNDIEKYKTLVDE